MQHIIDLPKETKYNVINENGFWQIIVILYSVLPFQLGKFDISNSFGFWIKNICGFYGIIAISGIVETSALSCAVMFSLTVLISVILYVIFIMKRSTYC